MGRGRTIALESWESFRDLERDNRTSYYQDLLNDIQGDNYYAEEEEKVFDPRKSRLELANDDPKTNQGMFVDLANFSTSEQPDRDTFEPKINSNKPTRQNAIQRKQANIEYDPNSSQNFDTIMKLRAQNDKYLSSGIKEADPQVSPRQEASSRQSYNISKLVDMDSIILSESMEFQSTRPVTTMLGLKQPVNSENIVRAAQAQKLSVNNNNQSNPMNNSLMVTAHFQDQLHTVLEEEKLQKQKDGHQEEQCNNQSDSGSEEEFIRGVTKEIIKGRARGDGLRASRDTMKTTFIEEAQRKMNIDETRDNKSQQSEKQNNIENDYVSLVNKNERSYLEHARKRFDKKQHFSLKNVKHNDLHRQDLITSPLPLQHVSMTIINRCKISKCFPTCVALTDELIMIGNSDGSLCSFYRESGNQYSVYQNKKKTWKGNAITCIDVHPIRLEYVLIGYQRGQIVLIDMTQPKKALKTIKEAHKGVALVSVKFCDWLRERQPKKPNKDGTLQYPDESLGDGKLQDKQMWMFVSLDCEGKAFINTVTKSLLGFSIHKLSLCDPKKEGIVPAKFYQTVAARFYNKCYPQGVINDSCTFVALGGPSQVKIYLITKDNYSLHLTFKNPIKFVDRETEMVCDLPQKAPALCWGFGRTPVFKFDSFSLLAIAWGPLIQLVALVDITQPEEDFIADGHYTLTSNFSNRLQVKQDAFVESMRFLNESLLIVITENYEVRILYTQKFNHGKFISPEEMVRINQAGSVDPRQSAQIKTEWRVQMQEVELQRGKYFDELAKSEYGQVGEQTVSVFDDTFIALGANGKVHKIRHYYWKESLNMFKKSVHGDWIKVFARALDFYQGNVKGFKGIEDNDEIRQEMMRAELKLWIKELIAEVIMKWRAGRTSSIFTPSEKNNDVSRFSFEDDSMADIKEFVNTLGEMDQDDMTKNYRILIRIAIEFCVEMQNPIFLFHDLFSLFMDENMEWLMVSELTPFILAGNFAGWELYEEILEDNIIKFQKQIFMQSTVCYPAENLEKMIINLNFSLCSEEYIQDLIQFCQENFLTTGLLYLCMNTLHQSEVVITVLTKMRDMYMRAQKYNQEGNKQELKLLLDLPINSAEKMHIEGKSIYIGYKLLWVIKLFLSGKNFPSGNIKQSVWNGYIHDVSELITRKDFLDTLFEIDAGAYFTILSVLFFSGQQCEFIKYGRSDDAAAIDHTIIMTRLFTYCQSESVDKHVRQQYLFFVANVASKSEQVKQGAQFYFQVVVDLIKYTEEYINYNMTLSKSSPLYSKKMMRQVNELIKKKGFTKSKYVWIVENNILNLLKMCEPLSDAKITQLIDHICHTQLDYIKHNLYEKREDYLMCLKLIMRGVVIDNKKPPDIAAFDWIKDKLDLLKSRIRIHNDQTQHEHKFEQLRREVIANMELFIEISPQLTIDLIDDRFDGDHSKIIQSLNQNKEQQLKYIIQLINSKRLEIQETIENYSLRKQESKKAQKYIQILLLHLELICQLKPQEVLSMIEQASRESYYPIEQAQKICQQYEQIEASALLSKKIGAYYESVQQYVWVLNNQIDCDVLKKEIAMVVKKKHDYSITEFEDIKFQHMHNINLFERIVKKIVNICDKHPEEVLNEQQEVLHQGQQESTVWKYVLDSLIQIKHHKKIHKREYSKNFIQEQINKFVDVLLKQITFREIADHVVSQQPDLQYCEVKELIERAMYNQGSSYLIHSSACTRTFAEIQEQSISMYNNKGTGLHFTYRICNLCRKRLDLSNRHALNARRENYFSSQNGAESSDEEDEFDKEDPFNERMYVFSCNLSPYNHTYHQKCLKRFMVAQQQLSLSSSGSDKRQNSQLNEEMFRNLRCPDCYKKNFDIFESTTNKSGRSQRRNKPGTESEKSSHSGSSSSNKGKPALTRKLSRVERQIERRNIVQDAKWAELNKKMAYFDEHKANKKTLTLQNFNM